MTPEALPIEESLPALRASLAGGTRAVLVAPPGAGKTTRVPLALLDAAWLGSNRIVMLEPRRLAARAAAHRMARTLGDVIGGTVGFRVRGDSRVGRTTRVEVVTEGVLTRLIQRDPTLDGVGLLIFDEFHERNLVADVGLALALQSAELLRHDLRILVMSATLDAGGVAGLLGGAPVIASAGKAHPVETRWVPQSDTIRIEAAVARVVRLALAECEGDVLAFLPGAAEIARTSVILAGAGLPPGTHVYSLHGSLPLEEQDRAIAPSPAGRRKIVLATSVAETSLTIEGVRAVVDSGLARVPRFSPRSGMTRLTTVRVSRDAAEQRRGRAGRVAAGTCYRLWDETSHGQLLPHRTPEILDADLAPLALDLAAAGIDDPGVLRWLDPPPTGALAQARELLIALGALDTHGRITAHGDEMGTLGIHPRLAHLIVRGTAMGDGALACDAAALLSARDLLRRDAAGDDPDIRTRLEILRSRGGADDPRADRGRVFAVREESRRLRAALGHATAEQDTEALASLVALAYPDRVALRRSGARGRFLMRNGSGARVSAASALADAEALAIADTDGAAGEARVFIAAPLTRDEIARLFGEQVVSEDLVDFDDAALNVRAVRRERLGALVLSEQTQHAPDPARVAEAFVSALRRDGLTVLPWNKAATGLRERLAFLHAVDRSWPDYSDATLLAELDTWLAPHVLGMRRRAELARLDLAALLIARLSWSERSALDTMAPTHIAVPSGSRVAVDYGDPAAPVLAVRLQELFGSSETPTVAAGRVALTLHLLSPAHRPVQVTRDLAGFWRTAYLEVRKDLRGRYPRHAWPEDPLAAQPTSRAKRR